MIDFARRSSLKVALVASLAACGFMLLGIADVTPAFGQPQSVQGPAGNNMYGNGVNMNPYIGGQQLVTGSPTQPTQVSRPAGWPGGPTEETPPTPPPRRRRFAAPFSSATKAAPAGGNTAAAAGATAADTTGTAAVGAAAASTTAAAQQAPSGISTAGYPGASAPVGPPPSGVQQAGATTSYVAPTTALPPLPPPTGVMPAGPAAAGAPVAGAAGDGTSCAPVLVASAMTTPVDATIPVDPATLEKQKGLPFGLPATFGGAEIIAWVGPEVILASDVLPDANRHLQKILDRAPQAPPADEIERARKLYMSKFLEHVIETKLVIVEGRRTLPKEAWGKIEKQFNTSFDKEYLKKMIDSEECRSRTELDIKLRKAGSSLEALRRQAMENSFAQHWMDEKIRDDHEITHEEMHAYYRAHMAQYETPAKARWEHLMARYDKFNSKEEAWQAIASWGRDVQSGVPFAKVAEVHSQDVSASDGGVHSWTNKDSLVSEVLDEAIFTLPVGQLSQILEDKRGFHIVRVVERNDFTVTPFTDAQPEIKKKIHEERINDKKQEYKVNLRKKIPVWNIFEEAAGMASVTP